MPRRTSLQQAHQRHERTYKDNVYCYPVISRRSHGLSIGINLNPDKACNFDCIYCQVDRSTPGPVKDVDLVRMEAELISLIQGAKDQSLFAFEPFDAVSPEQRQIRDIAFSGDGEPTTYKYFDQAVRIAVDVKKSYELSDTKLVLITDACYLTKPKVQAALRLFDENNGEIWAKLDTGTEEYYRLVNRPNFPLAHVLTNILDAARVRPIVIQSLWMRVHDQPPTDEEVRAFSQRLSDILAAGGQLKLIQIYTIARQTTEAYATPLPPKELEHIAEIVKSFVAVPIETFHGVSA